MALTARGCNEGVEWSRCLLQVGAGHRAEEPETVCSRDSGSRRDHRGRAGLLLHTDGSTESGTPGVPGVHSVQPRMRWRVPFSGSSSCCPRTRPPRFGFACWIFSVLAPQFGLSLFVPFPSCTSSVSDPSNTCHQTAVFLWTLSWMWSVSVDQNRSWLS